MMGCRAWQEWRAAQKMLWGVRSAPTRMPDGRTTRDETI